MFDKEWPRVTRILCQSTKCNSNLFGGAPKVPFYITLYYDVIDTMMMLPQRRERERETVIRVLCFFFNLHVSSSSYFLLKGILVVK